MKCEIYFAVLLALVLTMTQLSEQAQGRRKSQEVDDFSSEDVDSIHTHFEHRLTRFLRFAGMINKISEDTGLDKHDIVRAGRSLFQDRTSGRGREYHAAHVVRSGEINRRLQDIDAIEYTIVRNFLGHTDIVPRWNNVWTGVGGDIDRFQESNLAKVIDIPFTHDRLTRSDHDTLRTLKADYIQILQNWINKATDAGNRSNLEIAKQKIQNLSDEDLYQHGKNGYLKQYREPYQGSRGV